MPTGYTSIIEDKEDVTFKDYALRCARAFGALFHQREEDLHTSIRLQEPSLYHKKALEEATRNLNRYVFMTADQAQSLWLQKCAEVEKYNMEQMKKSKAVRARYARIRKEVEAYKPPTSEHGNYKAFMLDQIDMCYDPKQELYIEKMPAANPLAYLKHLIASAQRDIEYHTKEQADEEEKTQKANLWITELMKSLESK